MTEPLVNKRLSQVRKDLSSLRAPVTRNGEAGGHSTFIHHCIGAILLASPPGIFKTIAQFPGMADAVFASAVPLVLPRKPECILNYEGAPIMSGYL